MIYLSRGVELDDLDHDLSVRGVKVDDLDA